MRKITTVITTLLLVIISIPKFDFIYSDTNSLNIKPVEIQGRHLVENNEDLVAGRHTFILTAIDGAPMPEGSSSGSKKVTINSNETFRFGEIHFDSEGVYEYRVSREIKKADNLSQDNSTYKCDVTVSTDGSSVIVFEKIGTEGKPNIIQYVDKYIAPKDEGEVKYIINTGDESRIAFYLLVLIVSTVLMILWTWKKRQ